MIAQVQKWGNSLALRIPKTYADELEWEAHTTVETTIVGGKLVIETVQTPVYELGQLLAQITPDNMHGEIDTGNNVGKEVW